MGIWNRVLEGVNHSIKWRGVRATRWARLIINGQEPATK